MLTRTGARRRQDAPDEATPTRRCGRMPCRARCVAVDSAASRCRGLAGRCGAVRGDPRDRPGGPAADRRDRRTGVVAIAAREDPGARRGRRQAPAAVAASTAPMPTASRGAAPRRHRADPVGPLTGPGDLGGPTLADRADLELSRAQVGDPVELGTGRDHGGPADRSTAARTPAPTTSSTPTSNRRTSPWSTRTRASTPSGWPRTHRSSSGPALGSSPTPVAADDDFLLGGFARTRQRGTAQLCLAAPRRQGRRLGHLPRRAVPALTRP